MRSLKNKGRESIFVEWSYSTKIFNKEMKKYLKENIKSLPFILVAFIMFYSITTLATNYLFNSNEVSYDNSETGLHADEVQGAIDEVFQHATDYTDINNRLIAVENYKEQLYPVGSVYISFNNTMPQALASIGTWEAVTGDYVLKTVTSGTGGTLTAAGKTGGTAITVQQMPPHYHGPKSGSGTFVTSETTGTSASITIGGSGYAVYSNVTGTTGGGQAHDHTAGMPANVAVYMWKRTA